MSDRHPHLSLADPAAAERKAALFAKIAVEEVSSLFADPAERAVVFSHMAEAFQAEAKRAARGDA